jgi:hypothetical protein
VEAEESAVTVLCLLFDPSSGAVDLSRFLRQPVKTQNPLNGELSHGIVS